MIYLVYDSNGNIDLPRTMFLSMERFDFGYKLPNCSFSDNHYNYYFIDNWVETVSLDTGEFNRTFFTSEIAKNNRNQIFWQYECSACKARQKKWFRYYIKVLREQLQKRLLIWFKGYCNYKLDFEQIIKDFDNKISTIKFR